MSPIRLATGRTVSPLPRPAIAAARGLSIAAPSLHAFPAHASLRLLPDEAPALVGLGLEAGVPLEMEVPGLEPPTMKGLPLLSSPEEPPAQRHEPLPSSPIEGLALLMEPVGEPAPLLRAYLPAQREGEATVAQRLGPLEALRPRLYPPALLPDGPAPDLEARWFSHQVEALRALLRHKAFLLADDPGTGRRPAVAAALAAQFSRGVALRALIVAPCALWRTWVDCLAAWAPGLLITVVRGDTEARRRDWATAAHVYLTDYTTLAGDLAGGLVEGGRPFDVAVFDAMLAAARYPEAPLEAARQVPAPTRWGLAGARPRTASEWVALFAALTPDEVDPQDSVHLAEIQRRFEPRTLRRTRADLAESLPRWVRHRVWLDLDAVQHEAYVAALAEERHRLAKLGSAVTMTHIAAAVDRINEALNFAPDSHDGVKVRALVDLMEEITAGGNKAVVFTRYRRRGMDRLASALEVFGLVRLEAGAPESAVQRALGDFRKDPAKQVLLAHHGSRFDGWPLMEVGYVVHLDHGWDPAEALRAERRLFPDRPPQAPVVVYEFWVADTVDERLFRGLNEQGLTPEAIAERPEAASGLAVEDWLAGVLEVGRVRARPVDVSRPGSAPLPGTRMLRGTLQALSPERLLGGVALVMEALGFPETEPVGEVSGRGSDLLARRRGGGRPEQVLVRCLRLGKNVGVGEARRLIREVERRGDCLGAYLITTEDFTASCKRFAEESEGRLALISGAELYRHLQILGWLD